MPRQFLFLVLFSLMFSLGSSAQINPLVPVDLVVDHSVMVDYFGTNDAFILRDQDTRHIHVHILPSPFPLREVNTF